MLERCPFLAARGGEQGVRSVQAQVLCQPIDHYEEQRCPGVDTHALAKSFIGGLDAETAPVEVRVTAGRDSEDDDVVYGADGIEIDDYVRTFFRQSEIKKNTPLLTEFMGDIRALLDRIGERRGERLMLAASVHPREDANLSVGMDVRSWIREGFVDLVVINYGGFQFDQDSDHEWIAEEARKNGALVYSHLGRTPYDDRHHDPTIEMYRAAASNHVAAGADGIYLSSMDWPHSEREYLVMRELSDPDIFARKNKHYFPDTVSEAVYQTEPYAARGPHPVTNNDDGIFPGDTVDNSLIGHVTENGEGYMISLSVGVTPGSRPAANERFPVRRGGQ